jgi:hypothetical protein
MENPTLQGGASGFVSRSRQATDTPQARHFQLPIYQGTGL